MERIAQIRGLGPKHQYAIMCCDLSDIATYAKVDNATYRLLKANTPAITTFILPATSEVPRRLMHPKRKRLAYVFRVIQFVRLYYRSLANLYSPVH